jgi:hypothetical protein
MRAVLLAIQMLILLMPLGAEDPLARYVPASSLEKLRAGQTLTTRIPPTDGLTLLPAIASGESIAAEVKDRRPSLGVEITRLISGLPQQMDTKDGWLFLYNSLHAVSTMKGIPYYSVTRGKTLVLFTDSYAVDSASRKDRVSDPVFSELPPEDVTFTFQEDGTFGRNVYKESFSWRNDHLLVKIENVSTINFLFVPVIQSGNLVSEVALVPNGNDVMFYGVSYLTTSLPLGDRRSREDSLTNRLIAMAGWLKARLSGAQ